MHDKGKRNIFESLEVEGSPTLLAEDDETAGKTRQSTDLDFDPAL